MDAKLEQLFTPIVTANTDDDNVAIFLDQPMELAFGGFRRSWGAGDFFMRYRGKIEPFHMSNNYGLYHFPTREFTTQGKLPGRKLGDGGREMLGAYECERIFSEAYQQVAGHHQLVINPVEVLDYIYKRTVRTGIDERVINIQAFESFNGRQFAAQLELYDGQPCVVLETPHGKKALMLDERNSLLSVATIRVGEWIVVEPIGVVDGRPIGKAMRLHQPGIRMAIQHFKSGLLMPGDPRYSIHEGEDNNTIQELDIETFPFLEGQDRPSVATAPMMSFQLDTFVRSLKALAGYKRVELLFKNSFTPYVMAPYVAEGEAIVDVVASSFCQYKSGKVVTL